MSKFKKLYFDISSHKYLINLLMRICSVQRVLNQLLKQALYPKLDGLKFFCSIEI
jgi:hypothetical protein